MPYNLHPFNKTMANKMTAKKLMTAVCVAALCGGVWAADEAKPVPTSTANAEKEVLEEERTIRFLPVASRLRRALRLIPGS